jgi:F0F1-type ATP synthase assembly protein I
MNEERPPRAEAATAGLQLVIAMLLGGAVGLGLGTLIDLAVPLGLIGLFAGLFVGLGLVHARFRRV